MPEFFSQTGHPIHLDDIPKRIISVVPSQTELLADLDLEEEVIGITKFCIHPENWFRTKTKVGGTKKLNLELIHRLKPDLILANKEENLREEIEALQSSFPVYISDVHDISSAFDMIRDIAAMTGKTEKANRMIESIQTSFEQLLPSNSLIPAAYLIWREPYMTIGGDTFIHSMMEKAGFLNLFGHLERYPELSLEQLAKVPLLLLASEPFPFKAKHQDELNQLLPSTKTILVDGEMFSWYGSRMKYAAEYFKTLRST